MLAVLVLPFISVAFGEELHCGTRFRRTKRWRTMIGGYLPTTPSGFDFQEEFSGWPWQVFIHWTSKTNPNLAGDCGGTIIGSRWVLSAAHCFPNPDEIATVVFAGTGKHVKKQRKGIKRQVVHVHMLPKAGNKIVDDIAILELGGEPFEFSRSLHPICLPSSDSQLSEGSTVATAVGWGSTVAHDGKSNVKAQASDDLLELELPVVKCTDRLRQSVGEAAVKKLVCAGGEEGKGTCQGDSGGPLMVASRGKAEDGFFYQYGVISRAMGCAQKGRPAVSTRVSSYCSFIEQATSGEVKCRDPNE